MKNAVSKAIIKLFEKHGMVLTFSFEGDHELVVKDVFPRKIIHFSKLKLDKKIEQAKGRNGYGTKRVLCDVQISIRIKKMT